MQHHLLRLRDLVVGLFLFVGEMGGSVDSTDFHGPRPLNVSAARRPAVWVGEGGSRGPPRPGGCQPGPVLP